MSRPLLDRLRASPSVPGRAGSAAAGLALLLALAAAAGAPLVVVLGANRLLVLVLLAVGAWVTVRRTQAIDLGAAGPAIAGAYAGGVLASVSGVPVLVGLPLAAGAGAAVGALNGAVAGRVGRPLSALTSLLLAAGVVAVVASWPGSGGRQGYHAVALATGSDRGDLVVLAVLVVLAAIAVDRFARAPRAALAALAVAAPEATAATGARPAAAAAVAGAVGGTVLGVGGWGVATATGSVSPATFGLGLSVGLALAAVLGGRRAWSAIPGALVVYGPSVLWPTLPVLGQTPLLVLGPLGLLVLAVRPGGLVPGRRDRGAPRRRADGTDPDEPPPGAPVPSLEPEPLRARDLAGVPGTAYRFTVGPGEVVAVAGPNGSGKSTLLARVAGQLDDGGAVTLGGRRLGAGPVRRARAGLARTWQRPPTITASDRIDAVLSLTGSAAAARWASTLLGPAAATPAGADLVALAAGRPRVAVLDEPGAHVPPEAVVRLLRGLAAGGCAVLVAEHRPEVLQAADRVVLLDGREQP